MLPASPPTLRPATPSDHPFLLSVYTSTRLEELSVTDWSDDQKAQFCHMQFDAQDQHYRAHYKTAEFSIIEHDGIPVGRLYVDRWASEIRIMDIALLPGHRNKGLGTHLLNALIEESTASNKLLSIHVEKFNPALRLYERLGFKIAGEENVYWRLERPPGMTNDQIPMTRE
jgi:ribosomal protein S18 acetylase RimI-like enzyme